MRWARASAARTASAEGASGAVDAVEARLEARARRVVAEPEDVDLGDVGVAGSASHDLGVHATPDGSRVVTGTFSTPT